MKFFVSSVTEGYENYRTGAKAAIEALDHVAVVIELTHHASPSSPRDECFGEIEDSDVLVLLLGRRYGQRQQSGKSPTHEEWEHARGLAKKILVFVEDVDEREDAQEEFLREIGGWEDSSLWRSYGTSSMLITEIVRALRALEKQNDSTSVLGAATRLPPVCQERIDALRAVAPDAAGLLVGLLADSASRQPGSLSHLASDPPRWLSDGGHLAWEAISDFLEAHDLPGSGSMRMQAIQAGSPRRGLLLAQQAIAAAEDGNDELAESLLSQVQSDHLFLGIARARVADSPAAVVDVIQATRSHESEDADLARYSIAILVWAYWRLRHYNLAAEVLRQADRRFPKRAWPLLQQADVTLRMANELGFDSPASHELLSESAKLAVRSRDLFRSWDGPSHLPIAIAMQAFLLLADPQRTADLGLSSPRGEASVAEAADAGVQEKLAHAFLMLGRYDELNTLQLDRIDPAERVLIQAHQARGLGDTTALSKMQNAVIQAKNEVSLRKALLGLALLGEIDAEAMSQFSHEDTALFTGVAALRQGDVTEAAGILQPFWRESSAHASYLAEAHQQAGNIDRAIETLMEAARHFGIDSLHESAVRLLIDEGRLDEAASLAANALARGPSRSARHRYQTLLVATAERRQDWQGMESYARALVRESPGDTDAAWAVVYALHRQIRNDQAWAYLIAHDLVPVNDDSARLTSVVCFAVDSSEHDADRLLRIAETFSESEQASGAAIFLLMAGGHRFRMNDRQRLKLSELAQDFVARYPESEIFNTFSGEPEHLIAIMADRERERVIHSAPLINQVRYGRWPYGVLRRIRELPYADLLLSRSAGDITAISADEDRRDHERNVASQSLAGTIVVDTSVVAVGIHADLNVERMSTAFEKVLVPDELLIDARLAVALAKRPPDGVFGYDPGLGRPTFSEIDDQQRASALRRAEQALECLNLWRSVSSGSLPSPRQIDEGQFRPWDSSIRVALANGCPIWCDDLALRSLAESEGISAFGTWALLEILSSDSHWSWLPEMEEMKLRLLRAQIADVPISLSELSSAIDRDGEPDIAVQLFLRRPFAWSHDANKTYEWYLELLQILINGPNRQYAPGLLYAASYGLAAVVEDQFRVEVIGSLLASSLGSVWDPDIVPALLAAARYAAREIDPAESLDPLEDAVRHLLSCWEPAFGAATAAQAVRSIFSRIESDDLRTVMTVVLAKDR